MHFITSLRAYGICEVSVQIKYASKGSVHRLSGVSVKGLIMPSSSCVRTSCSIGQLEDYKRRKRNTNTLEICRQAFHRHELDNLNSIKEDDGDVFVG